MTKKKIWDEFYPQFRGENGIREIRRVNPFLHNSRDGQESKTAIKWLNDGAYNRLPRVKGLFNGRDFVPALDIKERGTNDGMYLAFLAVAHDMAEHDGNGGLIKIDGELWRAEDQNEPPMGQDEIRSLTRQPSVNDFDEAWQSLRNESGRDPDVDEVFEELEDRWREKGERLPEGWKIALEKALKER